MKALIPYGHYTATLTLCYVPLSKISIPDPPPQRGLGEAQKHPWNDSRLSTPKAEWWPISCSIKLAPECRDCEHCIEQFGGLHRNQLVLIINAEGLTFCPNTLPSRCPGFRHRTSHRWDIEHLMRQTSITRAECAKLREEQRTKLRPARMSSQAETS